MLKDYPDVLTVSQVAEVLNICEKSVYRLIKQKEIGSRKIGRKIIVPKMCVIDYLTSARYQVSHS